ncbi:hypothetical protein M8494_06305 [Serratia ureilytica]
MLAAIYQTNLPQVAIGNPAPAAPPTLSLKSFLRKEIAEGLVVVRDEAQQSVVTQRRRAVRLRRHHGARQLYSGYRPHCRRHERRQRQNPGHRLQRQRADPQRPFRLQLGASRWRAPSGQRPVAKAPRQPAACQGRGPRESNLPRRTITK